MAKECTKKPDSENPCSSYSGGQCVGIGYVLRWSWDLTLRGFGSRDGTTKQEMTTGLLTPELQWIKGKLGCISKPIQFKTQTAVFEGTGYNHTVEYKNSNGETLIRTFGIVYSLTERNSDRSISISPPSLVGVSRADGLPDNCGDRDHDEYECKCANTDETISCLGAKGNICCISKAKISELCAKV
jgi:hypothetical protein